MDPLGFGVLGPVPLVPLRNSVSTFDTSCLRALLAASGVVAPTILSWAAPTRAFEALAASANPSPAVTVATPMALFSETISPPAAFTAARALAAEDPSAYATT